MKASIPIYDLCSIDPGRALYDISFRTFTEFLPNVERYSIPHRHAFYHIMLCTIGSGSITVDFETFVLRPGRIFFMTPYQIHSGEFSDAKEGYAINYSGNLFSSFLSHPEHLDLFPFLTGIPKDSVIDLDEAALAEAVYFFKLIKNEITHKDSFSKEQVCFHLMSLFISISRHQKLPAKNAVPEQRQSILYNFRKLINQHYKDKRLPKDYAAMLYITPHRLNEICHTHLAMSAGEMIRNRVLLEAKRLLVNVDASITEIAYELNFSDNSYFTKFFKKYTHITPEEFRKKHIS